MPKNEIFILTHDHLKLLRCACVWWDGTEAGAPGIDPKRPYGDGDVPRSMAEILKIDPLGMEDDEPCLTKEQTEAAWQAARRRGNLHNHHHPQGGGGERGSRTRNSDNVRFPNNPRRRQHMIQKTITTILLTAVILTASWTTSEAQLVRGNEIYMDVERVEGYQGHPVTPDMTHYSNSDTLDLYVVNGDSMTAARIETVGLVGPAAWLILEWDEEAGAKKIWYQAKELEDGMRRANGALADTLQSYKWGNWTCAFLNGTYGNMPVNSAALADSIRFKCYGTVNGFVDVNLRGEYIKPTWHEDDAAAD